MIKYICTECHEISHSAASLDTLKNKKCLKCGAPIKEAAQDKECGRCRETYYQYRYQPFCIAAEMYEAIDNKFCPMCGERLEAETPPPAPLPEKIKLASLLDLLPGDTSIFIIDYLGLHKYEAVFEGLARETHSNGVFDECGESIVLSVSPEVNDTAPDGLTIPVLVVKIRRPASADKTERRQ